MKKRIFTVLLAAAMTVSLAACAGTAENNAGKKQRRHQQAKACQRRPRKVRPHQKKHLGEYTGTGGIG